MKPTTDRGYRSGLLAALVLGGLGAGPSSAAVITRAYDFTFYTQVSPGVEAVSQLGSFTIQQDDGAPTVDTLASVLAFSMTSGSATFGLADLELFRATTWSAVGLSPGDLTIGVRGTVFATQGLCISSLNPPPCAVDVFPLQNTGARLELVDTTVTGPGGPGTPVPEPEALGLMVLALGGVAMGTRRRAGGGRAIAR